MNRSREFSNIRKQHSRVASLSESQFAISRKTDNPQTPTAKFAPQQKKLRESAASSRSEYICINCVNHSLCIARKKAEKKEKEIIRSAEKQMLLEADSQCNRIRNQKAQALIKDALEYNQHTIYQHEKVKRKLFEQKLKEHQIINREQEQFQRQAQNDRILEENRRQQWRKQLELQIQERKQQNLAMIEQERACKNDMQFLDAQKMQSHRKEMQERYCDDLLRQIKYNTSKKKKEQKQRETEATQQRFALVESAYQREQRSKEKNQKERQLFLEEERQVRENQKRKKYNLRMNIERQKEILYADELFQTKQAMERKKFKDDQLNKYLKQIKHQMKVEKERKFEEIKERFRMQGTTLDFEVQKPEEKQCKSCDKVFPKTFMTRVKS